MMAPAVLAEIAEAFDPIFEAAGRPADMAIFTRHSAEGSLHCHVTAYFSPAVASLARAQEARPCRRPDRDAIDLLAGDPSCWAELFPDQRD